MRACRPHVRTSMTTDTEITIAALASAPGPAERGILRVSGPGVVGCLQRHIAFDAPLEGQALRRAARHTGRFEIREIGEQLPVQVLLWPTRRSYTGQPMAEIHTIGSPPLLEAILAQLFADGVQPAKAGEFTLRAFLAGRIDLVQAEAVLGVIDASDQVQLHRALRQLGGGVSGRLTETRAELIAILGDLEAGLDFVEEDIEFIPAPVLRSRLRTAIERLERVARNAAARMESTGIVNVVLAGLPNAGKSMLFNALAQARLAIVSPVPGTTRDYLTADLICDGQQVRLIDTAGQESTASAVAEFAQQQRGDQLTEARLVVWCSAADQSAADAAQDSHLLSQVQANGARVLHVQTKADLAPARPADGLSVSAVTGQGLTDLRDQIVRALRVDAGDTELVGSTGARCQQTLQQSIVALRQACEASEQSAGDEIIALELRSALAGIGEILGTVYTDDILDHVFSNFCIGK